MNRMRFTPKVSIAPRAGASASRESSVSQSLPWIVLHVVTNFSRCPLFLLAAWEVEVSGQAYKPLGLHHRLIFLR